MEEIDSLIGIAEDRTIGAIGAIDRVEFREPALISVASLTTSKDVVPPIALPTRIGELRDRGMGLSVYCGNERCGHLRSLDLDGLIEVYGTHYDFVVERRLASKLICKRCQYVGGKLVVVSDKRPRY